MRPELKKLIFEYLGRVSEACQLLCERLHVDGNLLEAWHYGRVPQKGWLDDAQSVPYCFHGIGCCVKFGLVEVDFDFGPGGRHDGFDGWRLARFAQGFERFEQFHDVDNLEAELRLLERSGEVVHLTIGLGGHLYYFAESG